MCVTDVVKLGKYKVLALCCIFFTILRNSQMLLVTALFICFSPPEVKQGSSTSQCCNLCQMATHMNIHLCSSLTLRGGIASIRKYGICLFFHFGDLCYTFRNYMDRSRRQIGSPGEKQNTTTCSSKTLHNQPADKAFGLDFFPWWCWMKGV